MNSQFSAYGFRKQLTSGDTGKMTMGWKDNVAIKNFSDATLIALRQYNACFLLLLLEKWFFFYCLYLCNEPNSA